MKPATQFVEVQFFAPVEASEPPTQVELELLVPDMGPSIEEAAAEEAPTAHMSVEPEARQITVGVLPVWGIAIGWLLTIILVVQGLKKVLEFFGAKDRLRGRQWERLLFVLPIVVGIALSYGFGPQLGHVFGLSFGLWASVLFLGPGSGMAAAYAYELIRQVLVPLGLRLLPSVVVAFLEQKLGLELPPAVHELADTSGEVPRVD